MKTLIFKLLDILIVICAILMCSSCRTYDTTGDLNSNCIFVRDIRELPAVPKIEVPEIVISNIVRVDYKIQYHLINLININRARILSRDKTFISFFNLDNNVDALPIRSDIDKIKINPELKAVLIFPKSRKTIDVAIGDKFEVEGISYSVFDIDPGIVLIRNADTHVIDLNPAASKIIPPQSH